PSSDLFAPETAPDPVRERLRPAQLTAAALQQPGEQPAPGGPAGDQQPYPPAVVGDARPGHMDLRRLPQPLARDELRGDLPGHPHAGLAHAAEDALLLHEPLGVARQIREVVAIDDHPVGARLVAEPRGLVHVVAGEVVARRDDPAADDPPAEAQLRAVPDPASELPAAR